MFYLNGYIAGVDLGGTKILTALADGTGKVLAEVEVPTEAERGVEGVLGNICATLEHVCAGAGVKERLAIVGVGAPGPLDPRSGLIRQAPNLGWRDVPLASLLEERLGGRVLVDNDANLAALGENVLGAGRGARNMLYITVSTGVGGGLIFNGEIYHGAGGLAGEVGHMAVDEAGPLCRCGARGCLEAVASGTAMALRARALIDEGRGRAILDAAGGNAAKVSAKHIARAAAAGDPEALVILAEAGRTLGRAVASLVNLLNPEVVVMGGGAMLAGGPLWDPLRDEYRRHALSSAQSEARVVPAELGRRAGVMGALVLVRSALQVV